MQREVRAPCGDSPGSERVRRVRETRSPERGGPRGSQLFDGGVERESTLCPLSRGTEQRFRTAVSLTEPASLDHTLTGSNVSRCSFTTRPPSARPGTTATDDLEGENSPSDGCAPLGPRARAREAWVTQDWVLCGDVASRVVTVSVCRGRSFSHESHFTAPRGLCTRGLGELHSQLVRRRYPAPSFVKSGPGTESIGAVGSGTYPGFIGLREESPHPFVSGSDHRFGGAER
jgi:hypothetical protein